jgi:outer membrane protein TolC
VAALSLALLLSASSLPGQDAAPPSYSLENNRELRETRLALRGADQQVREAWGNLFPEVDGTFSYQRNLSVQEAFLPAIIFDPAAGPDELIPVRFGADNNWRAGVTVSQPLFDAGALVGVGTASRFQALQQEVVRGRAQAIASQVRRSYYGALLAHEDVRVTRESIERTEETLRETQALNRAGLASDYDVLTLEVRLANLRPNLRRASNAAAEAERDLSVQLGMDEVVPVRVVGRLHQLDLTAGEANEGANRELLQLVGYRGALDASVGDLMRTARESRSDLRQARLNRELENARVRFERTSFFPKLSAFFNYALSAQENGSLDFFGEASNQRTTTSQVGVQLEIPIFSGFQRSARLQQRKLAQQQVEVQIQQIERRVSSEIRTALEALREARARAEAQRQAVSQARRGFEIVTQQYLAGLSSQLEVTEGEVLLRESEFNYAQAVYDYLLAQSDLDEAVGVVPLVNMSSALDAGVRESE